jgi:hypothetical protein
MSLDNVRWRSGRRPDVILHIVKGLLRDPIETDLAGPRSQEATFHILDYDTIRGIACFDEDAQR